MRSTRAAADSSGVRGLHSSSRCESRKRSVASSEIIQLQHGGGLLDRVLERLEQRPLLPDPASHRAVGRQGMNEARPPIGALGFRQQMFQSFQRDLAALRIPADLRRLAEALFEALEADGAYGTTPLEPASDSGFRPDTSCCSR